MRFTLAVLVAGMLATSAAAQPWYARGSFTATPWDTSVPMVDQGGGHWTADVTGLFDNQPYMYKLAVADWSTNMPSSDGRVYTDGAGEIHFHLYDDTSWDDGWFPNNVRRVGYGDHQQFDWEIVGSFNGFSNETHDPNYYLTDMGSGLHRGVFTFDAGIYDFKFRGLTPLHAPPGAAWDTSIGNDFGNGAGNNSFAVVNNGEKWVFELDLPNGRWRRGLLGDHNGDGKVNAADYAQWRDDPAGYGGAQGNTDWRSNFGAGELLTQAVWQVRGPQIAPQPLVDQGGGQYTLTIDSLTPLTDYELKAELSDLSDSAPGSNMKVRADAGGEIDLKFYELTGASWGDGWSPANTHRVGYADHTDFDWELIGSFNNWRNTSEPGVYLTDQTNGLHTGTFTFDTAGTYQFKFRKQDDWGTSIGNDFGNAAANNEFTVAANGDMWTFELDLPNGRWRAFQAAVVGTSAAVPEPASVLLALVGAVMMVGIARRK